MAFARLMVLLSLVALVAGAPIGILEKHHHKHRKHHLEAAPEPQVDAQAESAPVLSADEREEKPNEQETDAMQEVAPVDEEQEPATEGDAGKTEEASQETAATKPVLPAIAEMEAKGALCKPLCFHNNEAWMKKCRWKNLLCAGCDQCTNYYMVHTEAIENIVAQADADVHKTVATKVLEAVKSMKRAKKAKTESTTQANTVAQAETETPSSKPRWAKKAKEAKEAKVEDKPDAPASDAPTSDAPTTDASTTEAMAEATDDTHDANAAEIEVSTDAEAAASAYANGL
jgi:hypothetical protein